MLGIDPKLYRHFAIGTIAIAIIVAVFSSGGAQENMASNQQYAELKKAEEAKFGKTKLVDNRDDRSRQRAANAGFASDAGPPANFGGNSAGGGEAPPTPPPPAKMEVIIEHNQALLAKLSPESRAAAIKKLKESAAKQAAKGNVIPSPEQIEALAAASAARAGPPTTE